MCNENIEAMRKLEKHHVNISAVKIRPAADFYRETGNRRYSKMIEMVLEEGAISVKTPEGNRRNFTLLDLFSLPKECITLDLIKKTLEQDDLKKENLEKISEYLREAKKFSSEYLLINLPKGIKKIDGFKDASKLLNFLKHTATLRTGQKLKDSPFYCAIVKGMRIEHEDQKEEFTNLAAESSYLSKELLGTDHFHKKPIPPVEDWQDIGIYTDEETLIDAKVIDRGKEKNRRKTKMGKKPTYDVREAMNDALGLRFEIKGDENCVKVLEFITKYFLENFRVKDLEVRNNNFLNSENAKAFEKDIGAHGVKFTQQDNPQSNEKYRALDLKGKIKIPKRGQQNALIVERSFEVQIVEVGNENESGMSRHEIYEAGQKLSVITRDYGSFSKEYLNLICKEASEKTGLNCKKIEEHILETSLIKIKAFGGKIGYCSKEHFERWDEIRILPKTVKLYA